MVSISHGRFAQKKSALLFSRRLTVIRVWILIGIILEELHQRLRKHINPLAFFR